MHAPGKSPKVGNLYFLFMFNLKRYLLSQCTWLDESCTYLIQHEPAQLPLVTVRSALMKVSMLELKDQVISIQFRIHQHTSSRTWSFANKDNLKSHSPVIHTGNVGIHGP